MGYIIRMIAYVAFGLISAMGDISFRDWRYWALLAPLIVVDVSRFFDD